MNVPKLRFKEFDGEWEYHKFSDEIKLLGGATPLKSNKAYWNGDIVWLSSQEIKAKYVEEGTYKITQKAIDDNTTKMVKAGTPLIVSRSGILARMFPISMPTVDVAINQDIKALIFDKEQLDTDFLVGQLQAKECFILKSIVKTGTTVQSVNIPDLEKMKLSIPSSFKEQKKIGLFFKMIDEKIQLQQQKIDLLQEQKKGYMQKIFKGELIFKGSNRQWKEYYLHEILDFYKGKGISKENISPNGNPCILYGELYTKYGEVATQIYSKTNIDNSNLIKSKKYDVLIPSSGETVIDIACSTCLLQDDILVGGDLNILRVKQNKQIDGRFISYQINSIKKLELSRYAQGSSVVHLYNNEIKKIKLTIPNINEQNKISNFLIALDKEIKYQQKKLELLQRQKQGFMQQMFI